MSDSLLYNPSDSQNEFHPVPLEQTVVEPYYHHQPGQTIAVIQPGIKRKYDEKIITIYVPSICVQGQDLGYCYMTTLDSTDTAEAALKAVQQALVELFQNHEYVDTPDHPAIKALVEAPTTSAEALQQSLHTIGYDMELCINFVVKEIYIGLVELATTETEADKLSDDYVPLVSPEVWKQSEISGMARKVKKTKFFTSMPQRD